MPNDANIGATQETALRAEQVVREQAALFSRKHEQRLKGSGLLRYITTFVGGGGPRFWFSASPQGQQLNYAQILIEVNDKEMTPEFVRKLQPVLTSSIPGARLDARQLLTNPMDYPIEIRISSAADLSAQQEPGDIRELQSLATTVEDILRSIPIAERTRSEWGEANGQIALTIDPDRANLAGITNMDVANSSTAGISGSTVGVLQEGQKQIPIVARLRMGERAQLSDVQDLYVYGSQDTNKIKLAQISDIDHSLLTGRIVRQEQFRTINVRSFPVAGHLSSEVLKAAMPRLRKMEATLPPGYKIQIGGEYDKTKNGFRNLAMVMVVSIAAVFMALAFQFKDAIKPLLVLAAAPYGMIGAFAALWIMGEPFGFMAFLGVASLVGVIVSHSIVLFDFIEERHIAGDDFELALIDAGILRLRPVLITVFATVFALVPLAAHGGPLWKPLCYAQIGGLLVATLVTKLQVPVMYAIFVLDLKISKWDTAEKSPSLEPPALRLFISPLARRSLE
ncbi:efflux RND transporter permease subunit [Tunturiibacter gelidiferens]|uniref:efflux RND transporter permease subunit n=1 Tax=Tunturiibacter gelidiferens TaxID=3069689 RepID=UPI003D9B6392